MGRWVGDALDVVLGTKVGVLLGEMLGRCEGDSLDVELGTAVGLLVGEALGKKVGILLGAIVEDIVGTKEKLTTTGVGPTRAVPELFTVISKLGTVVLPFCTN